MKSEVQAKYPAKKQHNQTVFNTRMAWVAPTGKSTGIFLKNSFPNAPKENELIIPADNAPNTINCYVCGPTVYDMSHMGHARTYITVRQIYTRNYLFFVQFFQKILRSSTLLEEFSKIISTLTLITS